MSSGSTGVVVLAVNMVACGKFGVGLLVLQKLICSGYESVKRHGGLQWAVVNILV